MLVLALIGVWSLAPDSLWGGAPGPQRPAGRDDALVFLARLLPPVGIVIGVYLLWVGKDEPGGAFQGGALLAAMWILAMMAGLAKAPPVSRRWLRLVLVAGPVVFLAIGLAGFALAGRVPGVSGGLRQAADHRHRGGDDALHRGDPRPAGGGAAGTGAAAMSATILFALGAIGAGRPRPVRPDHPSRAAAQDPRLQSPRQRRLPPVRRGRAPGRGGRAGSPIRCRRRSSSPGSSSPSRPPLWRSRCCCGCSRRPAGPRCAPMPRADGRRWRRALMADPAAVSTPSGFLLVLALVLPVTGSLLALALGGRHAERIALALMPAGLVIAVAIAVARPARRRGAGLRPGRLGAAARPGAPRGRAVGGDDDDHGGGDLRHRAVRAGGLPDAARSRRRLERRWCSGRCCWALWGALNAVLLGDDLFNLFVALELLTFSAVPLVCLDGRAETLAAALALPALRAPRLDALSARDGAALRRLRHARHRALVRARPAPSLPPWSRPR